MPPRSVKKGTKRARQYEKIKRSASRRAASTSRAKQVAARTVNKNRARSGESQGRSSMNKGQLQRAVAAKSR